MRTYEYKTIKVKQGLMGLKLNDDREGLVSLLNNEGRAGWRVAHQPASLAHVWGVVLLEREV